MFQNFKKYVLITQGSLFDGIGGFPLSGLRHGIMPMWASEIEPFPMKITKERLPWMKHLGDITKINGAEIDPVDIITFGSPCQDLSVAGKRSGLVGDRSGLFMEATRIIREMREKTNGLYPKYAVWENVPGAFSSNNGQDFRAVLSEISQTEIPMPPSGRWATAGMVRRPGLSLAWRVLDAQYWGVPQRRKRIFLVADLGGQSAPEILFEPESMSGYPAESRRERKEVAADTQSGARTTVGFRGDRDGVDCVIDATPTLVSCSRAGNGCKMSVAFGPGESSEVAHCLRAAASKVDKHESTTYVVHPQITGTLCASGAGMSRPAGMASETDLIVAYTMQSFGEYKDCGVASSCKARDHKDATDLVVATVGCRNLYENEELSGTLQSKSGSGYSLNYQNPVRVGYMVRRLTPLECERLQGFPDGWTNIPGATDTARYKALGNSVAIPCVERVLGAISRHLYNQK